MTRLLVLSTNRAPFIEGPVRFLHDDIQADLVFFSGGIALGRTTRIGNWDRITGIPSLTHQVFIKKAQAEIDSILMSHYVKNRHYNIVHGHFLYPTGRILVSIGKGKNAKTVLTGHGSDVYNLPFRNREWGREIKRVLGEVDCLILSCRFNLQLLLQHELVEEAKCSVIYNGFDERLFRRIESNYLREKLGIAQDKKILICIGRYSREKNHSLAIRAMTTLKDDGFVLVLVGEGNLEHGFRNMIMRLGLGKCVYLHEWADHSNLPRIINSADMLLQTSLEDGFPTVIPESLACGKPVVSTRVGGIPEAVDSKNGVLMNSMSVDDLVQCVRVADATSFDPESIAACARQRFSYSRICRETYELYGTMTDLGAPDDA